MWKLINSELEGNTYERKYALNLYKLTSKRFPLITINTPIITNSTSTNILIGQDTPLLRNTETITPVNIGSFYLVKDLTLDLSDYLTEVPDSDLIITNNSYYCNYGNLNPFTLIHTNLAESVFLSSKYTFDFIVPNRNSNYEYVINLSNFSYDPASIVEVIASGIIFREVSATEGCPNYFTYNPTTKQLTLKGCNSCKPVTGDRATVYGTIDVATRFPKFTAYKFTFPSEVTLVSSLSYQGKTYSTMPSIADKCLLFSSELSACLCLTL